MLKKKVAIVSLVVLGVLAQAAPALSAYKSSCSRTAPNPGWVKGFSDGPR
jgi:hypothetical protein